MSEKESDKVVDLLIHKKHYVLNKKLYISLGNDNYTFVCRRCLNSYTRQNVLNKRCEEQEINSFRTSNESILFWKKNIFIGIFTISGFMQILRRVMKLIIRI